MWEDSYLPSQGTGRKANNEGNTRESLRFPFNYDPRNGRITLQAGISLDAAYYRAVGTTTANGVCSFPNSISDSYSMFVSNSRVKVNSAGRYMVIYGGDANAGVAHRGMLYVNGAKVQDIASIAAGLAWNNPVIIELAANDYIEIFDTAIVATATRLQVIKMDNI